LTNAEAAETVAAIAKRYEPNQPEATAGALREYWLQFEPNRGIELVKAEQREQLGAVGIPIPILKAIGSEIAKSARKDVDNYVPLAQLLWDAYGREGRVVALIVFGAMELMAPRRLVPLLKDLCRQCVSWEDADRLAMDAVEPIVRKDPDQWLGEMTAWLTDESKWVRRASVTIIGRLPMKHAAYAGRCLELTEQLLGDTDTEVKKAVSFAIRTCARVDPPRALAFLKKQVPATDPAAVWVLCDVIRSIDRRILAEFGSLLPLYQKWSVAPNVSGKDKRSIESAVAVLQAIGPGSSAATAAATGRARRRLRAP
jgi:3-methyladenine DNA glycosylase AlkD